MSGPRSSHVAPPFTEISMNDPTYIEASRKLAERMVKEAGVDCDARIGFVFRLSTARFPSPAEAEVLRGVFEEQLAAFRKDADAARRLLAIGESPRDERLDPAELAAWTIVASAILNLDEAVTKS